MVHLVRLAALITDNVAEEVDGGFGIVRSRAVPVQLQSFSEICCLRIGLIRDRQDGYAQNDGFQACDAKDREFAIKL